jgi:hypothetical protein
MAIAIRHRDEAGQIYMWESADGQQSFSIDDHAGVLLIESPYGSPRTTQLEIGFDEFRAGVGHDGVRSVFGDLVVQEILHELSVTTSSGQTVKRTGAKHGRTRGHAPMRRR